MTNKEELRILRDLLWKIGNACAGYKYEKIENILSEIRYGYCYGQSNSYVGQPKNESEKLRIESLKRLDKI
jgi:hypothetical protein